MQYDTIDDSFTFSFAFEQTGGCCCFRLSLKGRAVVGQFSFTIGLAEADPQAAKIELQTARQDPICNKNLKKASRFRLHQASPFQRQNSYKGKI